MAHAPYPRIVEWTRDEADTTRTEVIDTLRQRYQCADLVRIVTPSTSDDIEFPLEVHRFGWVTTLRYASAMHRIDVPAAADLPDLDGIIATARHSKLRADLVYVDPWHTYDDSMDSLLLAIEIVRPGGHIVLHDCLPRSRELADLLPSHVSASWCGETWRAFADLTARMGPEWQWTIVDSDFGIAIMSAPGPTGGRDLMKVDPLHPIMTWRRFRLGRRLADDSIRRVRAEFDVDEAWEWLQSVGLDHLGVVTGEEWRALNRIES
jgi:hypothetical protein